MKASAILRDVAHRPWPVPQRPWIMRQTWSTLLFAHWPVAAGVIQPLLPPGLELETWDGSAWLGIVPFRMEDVRARGLPQVPGAATFPELNVRTYVTARGKPGVWFFSLDAASRLAVTAARAAFHLPYYTAQMRCQPQNDTISYTSQRHHRGASPAAFTARYRPVAPAFTPRPGTLESFLTERYCLYAASAHGHLLRADITHGPWNLQRAEAEISVNTMAAAAGIPLPATQPLLHYSARQEALAWWPERIELGWHHNGT
jgi:uncharacterized protein YqjF (DUF2071 family)